MSGEQIRLVLSDVDGTLVTPEKRLTKETVSAVRRLNDHGIVFAITSGRPPRGVAMLIEPLKLTTPLAGFNGGLIVDPDMTTLQELTIRDELVGPLINVLFTHDLSVWVYQGTDWYVLDLDGPHVAHESAVCQFSPIELKSFDGVRGDIVKVVGVSDEPEIVARATEVLNERFAKEISATSSQVYYIDVTHHDANKGRVVDFFSERLMLETNEIVTIGDMANDVLMFEQSGVSIAMGNASDEVKSRATHVSRANDDNGFAFAVNHIVMGDA